jgi:xyloglucan-specific exo-beta-1,4-glucanase
MFFRKIQSVITATATALTFIASVPAQAASIEKYYNDFQQYADDTVLGESDGFNLTYTGTNTNSDVIGVKAIAEPGNESNIVMNVYDSAGGQDNLRAYLNLPETKGEDTGGIVTVEFRIMALTSRWTTSNNSSFYIGDGENEIARIKFEPGYSCGLGLVAPTAQAGAGASTTTSNLNWGQQQPDGQSYLPSGVWNTIKFMIDFNNKTFVTYFDGVQRATSSFISESAQKLDTMKFSTENNSSASFCIDDLKITDGIAKEYEESNTGYSWDNVPVGANGFVTGLAIHPKEKNLVYCRTDVGGAYRYDFDKEEWIPLNDSFDTSMSSFYGIDGIALDPNNPELVYIAAGSGSQSDIFKSYDRGETWFRLHFSGARFDANGGNRGWGECIAVDPNNSNIIYCGTASGGLWKSENAGASWTNVYSTSNPVRSVVFDENDVADGVTQTVYAGGVNENLIYTHDGGQTWKTDASSPKNIRRMDVNSNNTLYIASGDGLFSYDGTTYTDISPDRTIGTNYVSVSVASQNDNQIVCVGPQTSSNYMGTPIYLSHDGGKTWTGINSSRLVTSGLSWDSYVDSPNSSFAANAQCLLIDPCDNDRVWFGDFFGVYKTDNINREGNQYWKFAYEGIEEVCPRDFLCPPTGDLRLYAAIADIDGMVYSDYKSVPDRRIRANRDIPWMMGTAAIDYCEEKPNIVVRVGYNYYSAAKAEISFDGTETWQNITFRKKSDPNSVYDLYQFGQLAVSSKINPETGNPAIVVMPSGRSNLPLLVSDDLGETWSEVTGLPQGYISTQFWNKGTYLAADSVDGARFYMCDRNMECNFYVSEDWGKSWRKTANPGGAWYADKTYVKTAPGIEHEVWLSSGGRSLWKSHDGGESFTKMENIEEIESFGFGKNEPGRTNPTVYAYAKINGVKGAFRSVDMGETWVRINDKYNTIGNQPIVMEGDMQTFGVVYIGTGGRGIFYGEPVYDGWTESFAAKSNLDNWTAQNGDFAIENGALLGKSESGMGLCTYNETFSNNSKYSVNLAGISGKASVIFGYKNDNNYYSAEIADDKTVSIIKTENGNVQTLAESTCDINTDNVYITLETSDGNISVYQTVEGEKSLLIQADDDSYSSGKYGVGVTDGICSFDDIYADMPVEAPAEYSLANASLSVNAATVSVTADVTKGEDSAYIMTAAYREDGSLAGIFGIQEITGDMKYTAQSELDDVSYVSCYIWNDNMMPMCVTEKLYNIE